MSYQFNYNYAINAWHLAYSPIGIVPGGYPDPEYVLPGVVPDGDWSLYAEMYGASDGAAAGLLVEMEDGERIALLGTWNWPLGYSEEGGENIYVRQHLGTIWLRIDYHAADQELHLRSATTPGVWQEVETRSVATPVDTGLLLKYAVEGTPAEAFLTNVTLVPTIEDLDGHTEMWVPMPQPMSAPPAPAVPSLMITGEPLVYAMIGAPFGDMEFDVGKSARWLEYFSDKLFVLDVNMGDPRYWIVNWTITFPNAEHSVTSINYFAAPTQFRKEQWRKADLEYKVPGDAWVLWVDASEGLSFDNASLPDDYVSNPFMSFVYREITRAETADEDSVVLPFFVFLRSDEIQNVTYAHGSNDETGVIPPVMQAVSVPYYLPYQGLRRLMRASVLRDPDFDWASLDQPETPSPGVKAQIISYAYAHWQMPDIPPGESQVPELSEANDLGWQMRKKISRVRPIEELPFDEWYVEETGNPAGVPGPWAAYTVAVTNPDFVPITDTPVTEPDAAAAGLKTPLYDCVIRLNMRDGVWYEGDASGNTPLVWDSENSKWTTPYNPDTWPDKGVKAGANPDYVEPPTPAVATVRLDGRDLYATFPGGIPGNQYAIFPAVDEYPEAGYALTEPFANERFIVAYPPDLEGSQHIVIADVGADPWQIIFSTTVDVPPVPEIRTIEVLDPMTLAIIVTGATPFTDYIIDWDDGETDNTSGDEDGNMTVSHTYDDPGTYSIVLQQAPDIPLNTWGITFPVE